jgi:hypothetical protein
MFTILIYCGSIRSELGGFLSLIIFSRAKEGIKCFNVFCRIRYLGICY